MLYLVMENTVRQEACGGCPFEQSRSKKIGRLIKAMRHLDYCRDELFGGEPILSDVEEDMARGLIAQQDAQKTGDEVIDNVHLVRSIAESGSEDNHDFLARVVCWMGIQRQQEEIAALEEEINVLSCGTDCLDKIG